MSEHDIPLEELPPTPEEGDADSAVEEPEGGQEDAEQPDTEEE